MCGAKKSEDHVYDGPEVNYSNTQHTKACVCGATQKYNHKYTGDVVYLDANSHTKACACGATQKYDHSYTIVAGEYIDTKSCYKACACGAKTAVAHKTTAWSIAGDSGSHKLVCDYCGRELGVEKHSYKSVKSDVYPYDYMYSYCTKCGFRQ